MFARVNGGIPDPLFTITIVDFSVSGLGGSYGINVEFSNSDIKDSSYKILVACKSFDTTSFGIKFSAPYSGGGSLYLKKAEVVNPNIKVKYSGDMNTIHTSTSNPVIYSGNYSHIDSTTGVAIIGSKIYVYRNL